MALSSDSPRTTVTPSRHFSVSGIVKPVMFAIVYGVDRQTRPRRRPARDRLSDGRQPPRAWSAFASSNRRIKRAPSEGCSSSDSGSHSLRGTPKKSPPYTWMAPVRRGIGLITEWIAWRPSGSASFSRADRLHLTAFAFDSPPEDVVLAAGVDADHSPHPMIVRQQHHSGGPDDVQDRQIGGAMQRLELRPLRLSDRAQDRAGLADGARHHLPHRRVGVISAERGPAVLYEALRIEHGIRPPWPQVELAAGYRSAARLLSARGPLERENGTVEICHRQQVLPYSVFDKNPHISQGA